MSQSRFSWPLINDNITREDKDILIDFINQPDVRFTNGAKVREFEQVWGEWLGTSHNTFVNSGASANYIMTSIVKELRGPGEIIVPPLGWVSDIAPVVNLGMIPVFADVDKRTFAMSLENIKAAVTPQTKAIVLVHALGFNGLSQELLDFVKEQDILLIEDCCESHGVTFNGQRVGSFGDMSNFSYYFGHHITTIEGGMVCTNNPEIHEYARLFRSHGMTRETSPEFQERYNQKYPDVNPLFMFAVAGYNFRSMEMNAVLGLNQMKKLDYNIQYRIHNLNVWLDHLDKSKYFVDFERPGNSNFALPLLLDNKDKLKAVASLLEDEKVEYRLGTAGGGNQARQPYLREGKYDFRCAMELQITDHIHEHGLYVGNHTELSDSQIINLCNKLNQL